MNCDSCVWKGKQIESIKFDEDRIVISFTDGKGIMIYDDDGQSCCETRYIHTDVTDLSYYNNTILNDIDVVDGPDIDNDYYSVHETQFLYIHTSLGVIDFVTHNEHNGYYGGFDIVIKEY